MAAFLLQRRCIVNKRLQTALLLFFVCIICISGWYIYKLYSPSYNDLYIDFVTGHELLQGSNINAIELIDQTSAAEIITPELDTSKLGKQQLIYIAKDAEGFEKAFVLEINIVSQLEPVIKLSAESVTIIEGELFDPLDYLVSCTDETDGELQPIITNDYDPDEPGTYDIYYSAVDQDGNTASATLHLIVIEKPIVKQPITDKPSSRPPETSSNAPEDKNEQQEQPTNETQPHAPHENWKFYREEGDGGYSYQDAIKACADLGRKKGSYECIPYTDVNGEPAGIQIYY